MDNQEKNSSSFDSLVKDMKSNLRTPTSPPAPEDCPLIFWVDDQLCRVDRGGYTPQRVHIGALHWEPSHRMEQEKKNRLFAALRPIGDEQQREKELRRYLKAMADVVDSARPCYNDDSTSIRINDDSFACMLLLDGYFVLSCLEVTGRSGTSDLYDRDVVFLVENQVPFFVLEEVHRLVVSNNSDPVQDIAKHMETWVLHHHRYVHSTVIYSTVKDNLKGNPPCHLLHLLHAYFRPTAIDRRQNSGSAQTNGSSRTRAHIELIVAGNGATSTAAGSTDDEFAHQSRWRSATYYHAAGVRLVKRELDGDEARSILDVEVRKGVLHVPCLRIDGNTVTMLRNMVALEQHYPTTKSIGTYVAAYCHFLSQVAGTEEDVRLLSDKGIIVHRLGKDSDVADGFANLCRGIIVNMGDPGFYYLKRVQVGLEEHCKSRWRKSMAWLRHTKCNNILMAGAVAAAVILFLCTVEQSFFAALSYATGK